jgi:hypothetical protein
MRGKMLFVVEIIVVTAVFWLDYRGILPVSKTPYLFLVDWISRYPGLESKIALF